MKYFIPIDRTTIRENPNAGNTVYYQQGPTEYQMNLELISWDNKKWKLTAVNKTAKQNINKLYSLTPEGSHFYDFEKTIISCDSCGKTFSWDQLKAEGCDDFWSDRICPSCEAWDCCELEFERLNDILKEDFSGAHNK